MFSVVSGQCRSYSFIITKQREHYEIRMNETTEGIKLWFLLNDDCVPSVPEEGGA